jgi:hypothetical protein
VKTVARLPGARLAAGLAVAGAAIAVAAAPPEVDVLEPGGPGAQPRVEALEPGTRGTIVASLDGNRREEIPFRYLGTLEGYAGPGYDLHLVRMEGPTAERVGAANGLSGSPAYVDGRLLGALAYRIGRLPKDAVAGITPIENLLAADQPAGAAASAGEPGIVPIGTPVFAGGLADPVRRWLAPELDALGLFLVGGGGGSGGSQAGPAALAPGSPVGVALIRGDLDVGATGTVTLVEGDRVYAFGHPFLGAGAVELPMASAHVVHALGDLAGGVLLANLGPTVGAIEQDRLTGVVGRLGRAARTIPVRMVVRGGDYGERRFAYEVARQREIAPLLVAASAANSLIASTGYSVQSTVRARGTVRLRGIRDLPLEMAFAGDDGRDPAIAVASELFATLRAVMDNPVERVEVEDVELEVEAAADVASYRVESVRYDRGTLAPGEPLRVSCVLRAFRGGTSAHVLELELPATLPREGTLVLAVGDPRSIEQALGAPLEQRVRSSPDAESLVLALGERRSPHRLTAVVYEPGGAIVSRGLALTELPPTAQKLLSLGAPPQSREARGLVSPVARAERELDGPVRGGTQLRLRVTRDYLAGEDR